MSSFLSCFPYYMYPNDRISLFHLCNWPLLIFTSTCNARGAESEHGLPICKWDSRCWRAGVLLQTKLTSSTKVSSLLLRLWYGKDGGPSLLTVCGCAIRKVKTRAVRWGNESIDSWDERSAYKRKPLDGVVTQRKKEMKLRRGLWRLYESSKIEFPSGLVNRLKTPQFLPNTCFWKPWPKILSRRFIHFLNTLNKIDFLLVSPWYYWSTFMTSSQGF